MQLSLLLTLAFKVRNSICWKPGMTFDDFTKNKILQHYLIMASYSYICIWNKMKIFYEWNIKTREHLYSCFRGHHRKNILHVKGLYHCFSKKMWILNRDNYFFLGSQGENLTKVHFVFGHHNRVIVTWDFNKIPHNYAMR